MQELLNEVLGIDGSCKLTDKQKVQKIMELCKEVNKVIKRPIPCSKCNKYAIIHAAKKIINA